jgi:hypothetical protein
LLWVLSFWVSRKGAGRRVEFLPGDEVHHALLPEWVQQEATNRRGRDGCGVPCPFGGGGVRGAWGVR